MPIKLYISQANQGHNAGPGGYTEKAGMDAIIHKLLGEFAKDSRFKVYHTAAGTRIDTAAANCDEANRLGVDYYVALHSNAGGVGARGTIGFYHSRSPRGKSLCAAIVRAVSPLSPGADKGIHTMDGFIEIHRPNAPAVLIELESHDKGWIGAAWLMGKRPAIARALYEGICKGVGVAPRLEKPVPAKPPKPLTTGKSVTVKVPTVRPRWWKSLMAWVKRTR